MWTRILAAVVLLPLLLAVVLFLPAIYTAVLFGVLAAIGCYELLWRTGLVKHGRIVAYCAVMAVFIAVAGCLHVDTPWIMLAVLLFAAALYGEMLAAHTKLPFQQIAIAFFSGLAIPYFLTALGRIRAMEQGNMLVMIPFVLAFLSDTGAYFTGRALGKHKLAPVISPNKTVEGVIGGAVGAIVGMAVYCLILEKCFDFQANYGIAVLYGILGSFAAVFGDLTFSVIKRQTGIKDYGNLIPGHGGALDRFDSMTIVAPLAEVLLAILPVVVK